MPLYTKFSTTTLPLETWCAYCDTPIDPYKKIFLQETDAIMQESTMGVDYTIMCERCYKVIRRQCQIWNIPFEDDADRLPSKLMAHTTRKDF